MDHLTPQQTLFLAAYLDPKSDTWSNAKQSALKAGYTDEYSDNITGQMPKWLSDALGENELVRKALSNLSMLLEEGEDKKILADMTKFTLSKLSGKFKDKLDVTSGGEKIQVQVINYADKDSSQLSA